MKMTKKNITDEDLKLMKGSVVLLHGVFEKSFFDMLESKEPEKVFVMEGRPSLEAAKVASSQLLKRGITPTIIADNMAGFIFNRKMVKEVWLAYETIHDRGALCYIGSSILGVLAKKYDVPVYCYPGEKAGKGKNKLMGDEKEITTFNGVKIAAKGTRGYVPLFEHVPGHSFEERDGSGESK